MFSHSTVIQDRLQKSSSPGLRAEVARRNIVSLGGVARSAAESSSRVGIPSFSDFAAMLEAVVVENPELQLRIEQLVARAAREALAKGDVAVPSTAEVVAALRLPASAVRGGTVARAFWWGFHIQISSEDLRAFLDSAEPVNAVIGAVGGSVPSPAAPFIAIAAAFVAGALGVLRDLDHGNGVYVSMSWFAPGAFIPTSV